MKRYTCDIPGFRSFIKYTKSAKSGPASVMKVSSASGSSARASGSLCLRAVDSKFNGRSRDRHCAVGLVRFCEEPVRFDKDPNRAIRGRRFGGGEMNHVQRTRTLFRPIRAVGHVRPIHVSFSITAMNPLESSENRERNENESNNRVFYASALTELMILFVKMSFQCAFFKILQNIRHFYCIALNAVFRLRDLLQAERPRNRSCICPGPFLTGSTWGILL